MSDLNGVIAIMRALTQFGITAEQYQKLFDNPDMSDEDLAEHLANNSDKMRELRDRDH